MATRIRNVLTIDVEDWHHDAEGLRGTALADPEPRVEANLRRLLELLGEHEAHATLFVLGDVARRFPAVIREAFACGHEVASHGDRHRPVGAMLRREFRTDVQVSLQRLEDLTGARVAGYRAPYFSIKAGVHWPGDVLAEIGVGYDSSVLPIDRPPGFELVSPRAPYRLASGVWEVPVAVNRLGCWNLPLLGGFALRALPLRFVETRLTEFNRELGPAVVHLHPWEIDAEGPEAACLPRVVRRLKRMGRRGLLGKLHRLLAGHAFGSIAEVFPAVVAGANDSTPRHDRPSP
jgi:polysaccharide deacetylase family protein (PEP-CTERM system associated)